MTFAARLATESRNLRRYVTIEGIRHIFHNSADGVPSALITSTRTRLDCISAIEQDRRELDMVTRRAKGGGLRLRLLDDDSFSLRDLFSMRQRRATFITANVTAAASTITVKNTSGLDSSGEVWVGEECIAYTGKTSTTLTGCTRGAYGTTARPLRGGSNNGQAVYAKPPSWIGRRISVYGFFLDADGEVPASSSMQALLGTFEIDAPPQYVGGNEWEVSAIDPIDNFMAKAIYTGVEPTTSPGVIVFPSHSSTSYEATLFLTNTDRLKLFGTTADDPPGDFSWVRLDGLRSNMNMLVIATDLQAVDLTGGVGPFDAEVTVNYEPLLNRSTQYVLGASTDQATVRTFTGARPVAYLREKADVLALRVLTSITGDSTNGIYDTLRGLIADTSTESDPDVSTWSIGARIKESDIDFASFAAVGSGVEWFYLVDEPTTVGDFLRDFCLATDSFVTTNIAGQLAVMPLSEAGDDATVELDADDLIEGSEVTAVYDEENIYPRVLLKCSYDSRTEEFNEQVECNDNDLAGRYPRNDRTLTIESKSTFIAGLWTESYWIDVPAITEAQARARLRRYQSEENGLGALYLDARVHLDHALLDLGDIVSITSASTPNMEGGTISDARARVVSILPAWSDGFVDLRLQVLRGPKVIAPAAVIASVAGNTLTLSNSSPISGTSPGNMFGVGNNVIIWDVSTGASHATTVTASSATTVTVNALPGSFTIANGADFITHGLVSVLDTNPTPTGYTPLSDFIYQVDTDETDYADDVPTAGESRWR